MPEIQSLWVRLGFDSAQFKAGIEQAKTGMVSWRDETNKSSADMLKWGAAIGATVAPLVLVGGAAYETAKQINALVKAASEVQSQIDRLSVTTGMNVTELYKWSNVARYADSDINSLSGMIRKLSINITESGESGDKARAMLAAMHISIKNADGSTRSFNEIFPDIIEGLRGIEDTSKRNVVANTLLGKSYPELAGYMLMSKDQIKGYFDEGWAPTAEQSQKLRDYETATKDLNASMSNLNSEGGIAFSSSMREIAVTINDAVKEGAPLLEFLKSVNSAIKISIQLLDDAATGYQVMNAAAKGDFNKVIELGQGLNARTAAREARDRLSPEEWGKGGTMWDLTPKQGIDQAAMDAALAEKASSSSKDGMTSFQIKDMKLDYEKMTKRTIPDQEESLKKLKTEYNFLGDKGSEAAKKIKKEIDDLDFSIAKNKNQVAEWGDKLTKAGAPFTATGDMTYNQQFASSLNTGGVGPDTAGFSEMANLTPDVLAKMAAGDFAMTGGSKAMAEEASTYPSRMGTGGAAKTGKKTASPAEQAGTDTKTITLELDKQGTAYTNLTDVMMKSWIDQEQKAVIHYTAMSEMARIQMQKLMDDWYGSAKYITNTVAYAQTITVKDGVPAASPRTFDSAKPPVLETIDLSKVPLSSGAGASGGAGGAESGSKSVTQNNEFNFYGVKNGEDAVNRSLGKMAQTGGLV